MFRLTGSVGGHIRDFTVMAMFLSTPFARTSHPRCVFPAYRVLKAEKSSEFEEEEHDASPDFMEGAGELDLETQEKDEVGVFACGAEGENCSSLHRVAQIRVACVCPLQIT